MNLCLSICTEAEYVNVTVCCTELIYANDRASTSRFVDVSC